MILIISTDQDPHTTAVKKVLDAKGAEHRTLDLSEFPMSMEIGLSFANGAASQYALRFKDGARIDVGSVKSVWWRRPQGFGFPQTMSDPVNRGFAHQESDFAFKGMWLATGAYWMNDINRDLQASHKVWQLSVARELGLSIPRTLITNSATDARRFKAESKGRVIYKAFLASPMAWRETRILEDADMEHLDAVQLAPVIFQSYVPSVADLRVTCVGRKLFPAAADIAKADYMTDVRMNPGITWRPYDLPKDVADKVLKMMDLFDLEYGAFDFRVTPEGEHVFLEVNPAGQFLFIENATGLKITDEIAGRMMAGSRVGQPLAAAA